MKFKSNLTGRHNIEKYLSELPDGYRERALSQINEKYSDFQPITDSVTDALEYFQDWKLTEEGQYFWIDMHDWVLGRSSLPKLPELTELEKCKMELAAALKDRDEWKKVTMSIDWPETHATQESPKARPKKSFFQYLVDTDAGAFSGWSGGFTLGLCFMCALIILASILRQIGVV